MKLHKRIAAGALAALMMAAVASGCQSGTTTQSSGGGSGDGASEEKVAITVSGWPKKTDTNYAKQQAYLETFKKKYPNIEITTDEWSYDANSFLPKAASGQLPTVWGTWFTEANKIMDSNYAKDITALAKKYGYADAINPAMMKLITRDGKIYGLPNGGYSIGLLCNVNLFKQAGLVDANGVPKFPTTWDEVATTAQTIKQKTGKAGFAIPTESNCGGWMFMNIAWSYGTVFETKEDGKWKATFNSPECEAALKYLSDLKYKYNVVPENALLLRDDTLKMIGTDQLAMTVEANDMFNNIINTTKISKDALAMTTVPAGPKGKTPLMGGGFTCFAPNATDAQVEAGIKWLQVTGFSPDVTDEVKQAWETGYKGDSEKGLVVGPKGFALWTNKERVDAENAVKEKYKNVNMDLWKTYDEHCTEGVKVEEPVNAQELYKAFDSIIQNVFTDKNVNIKQVLDDAAKSFQSDYLDSAQ